MPTRTIGDRTVEVSNPDKVLWPEAGVTKADLMDHWERVGGHVLDRIRGRPLTLYRCPDGIDDDCWFHKDAGAAVPGWVRTATLGAHERDDIAHVVAEEPATLVVLAQLASVEVHVGPCPVDDLDHPAELVFDLDPPDGEHAGEARRAARRLRSLLEEDLGLTTFVKASGSKGFHVHVPLDGSDGLQAVRGLARDVAEEIAERHPDDLTVAQRRERREGRIFVDWLRNHPAQTVVAPYSVRDRPGATVAVPLAWDELSRGVMPDRHTVASVPRRLGQRDDPWAGMEGAAQSVHAAVRTLAGIRGGE